MDRQKLEIANPCSKNFDEMEGEGHRRFCDQCQKHVHNLSDLTRAEAIELLRANAGSRTCVVYTFDAEDRVRFREDMGFRRPPKAQLAGVKRLLAAAAMVPLLAALPACDSAPTFEPPAILQGYQGMEQADPAEPPSTRPIDHIIDAEQRFVDGIKDLLGFVPDYEMIAGEPAIDPTVYAPEPPAPELMGEMMIEPALPEAPEPANRPIAEPIEPQVVPIPEVVPEPVEPEELPTVRPPKERFMIMGDVAVSAEDLED